MTARKVLAGVASCFVVISAVLAVRLLTDRAALHRPERVIHANDGPSLTTVDAATLESLGIVLSSPTSNQPVTQASAEEAALAEHPDASIRETVLAHVSSPTADPPVDADMWLVSLMPSGGIWSASGGPVRPDSLSGGSTPIAGTFLVAFIDAGTGQWLYETSGTPQ